MIAALGGGGACSGHPGAVSDLGHSGGDMGAPSPDLGSLCPYGQSMMAGVCGCDADHAQACSGGLYCCASVQMCLGGETPRCSGPAPRQRLAMAYDPHHAVTLLSGGQCDDDLTGNETLCADQWLFDPTTFHPLAAGLGPSPRSGASLSWDGNSGKLLLFGGQLRVDDITALSDETWLWDGATWTQVMGQGPPARAMAGLAYDSVRKRVVLYGGDGLGDMALDDTWEWDGSRWLERPFDNPPTAREGHGMVYDQKHGYILMHGGLAAGVYVAETWTYDGNTWNMAAPAIGMPERGYFGMAYDSDRGVVVLHGGDTPGIDLLTDTWEWDGTTWNRKLTATAPPARVSPSMSYDPIRKLTLLFGGVSPVTGLYNDLWAWDGTNWKQLY